jgi:hypothetical protein
MRVTREEGALHATGEITDGAGAPVAHRTIDRGGTACAGLGRAVGVWASLVLDEEVERAIENAPVPAPPAAPPQPAWPAPAPPPEKPSPESQLFLVHEKEERNVEIGIASLAMSGTNNGMIAGGSLFEVTEVGAGWFLRPSLQVGRSVLLLVGTTLGEGRFDACKRIPGNYLERRGLQVDLCAGPEVGFLRVDSYRTTGEGSAPQTLPVLAAGPSLDFRGELGNALSVLVRGVLNVNMVESTPDGVVSEPILVARAEVGLSWRLR